VTTNLQNTARPAPAPQLKLHYGIRTRIRWALCSAAGGFRRRPTRHELTREFEELAGDYAKMSGRYRALQLVLEVVNMERDRLSPELRTVVAIYGGPDALRSFEQEEARGHAFTPRPPSPDGRVLCDVCALREDVHEAAVTPAVAQ
jgi:hypothetical protein